MPLPPLPPAYPSHSCYSDAFNTPHQWKEAASCHSPLCPHRLHHHTGPVASWGSPRIKATARHAKPLILPHCQSQHAITFLSGSAESVMGNPLPSLVQTTHSHDGIQTVPVHIWSVFVPILQSWKSRHSGDTLGTLFSKQASQHRRRSVIINTMTPSEFTLSAILVNVYCVVKLPVCSCVSHTHLHYRWQCSCRLLPFS